MLRTKWFAFVLCIICLIVCFSSLFFLHTFAGFNNRILFGTIPLHNILLICGAIILVCGIIFVEKFRIASVAFIFLFLFSSLVCSLYGSKYVVVNVHCDGMLEEQQVMMEKDELLHKRTETPLIKVAPFTYQRIEVERTGKIYRQADFCSYFTKN